MNNTRILALVAAMTLLMGAFVAPVGAQPDDRPGRDPQPDDRPGRGQQPGNETDEPREPRPDPQERRQKAQEQKEKAQERREAAREKAAEARERFARYCEEPENETVEERCEKARNVHAPAMKARREAHAGLGGIRALEHKIAQLEILELRINQGNVTNATEKLERIDALQQKLAERLVHLYGKVDALREKWAEVREHVAEKRQKGAFAEAPCDLRYEAKSDRIEEWYEARLAGAAERLDRQMARDNLTQEEKAEIRSAYNETLTDFQEAYEERKAEAEATLAECQADAADDADGADGTESTDATEGEDETGQEQEEETPSDAPDDTQGGDEQDDAEGEDDI